MNVGPARAPPQPSTHPVIPSYTVLVVGPPRAGKSSLIRLFLDTAPISPHATPAQRESLARFLNPSKSFPECEIEVLWDGERVLLRLIDSPALNYASGAEEDLDRTLNDIISLVEDRYIEGAREEGQSAVSESHIHLCLYVLDPASIVPRYPPSPSHRRSEPIPPKLPSQEISLIHKLSSRVNVLPVLGRSDNVTLDQLVALKHAVRTNLAEAGLGFGIFDEKGDGGVAPTALPSRQHPRAAHSHSPRPRVKEDPTTPREADMDLDEKPRLESHIRTSHSRSPTPPQTETIPLLPFAFFAPEVYPRDDLEISDKDFELETAKGRFIRQYRWGVLDCIDRRHSDFVTLRKAIMDCRKELKSYTKDFLYERFKVDFLLATQHRARTASSASSHPPPPPGPPSAHMTSPRLQIPASTHSQQRSPLDTHPRDRRLSSAHDTRLSPHHLPHIHDAHRLDTPQRLSHPHLPHARSLHVLPPPYPASPIPGPPSAVPGSAGGGRLPPMVGMSGHLGSVHALLNHSGSNAEEKEREKEREMQGAQGQGQMMVQVPLTVTGRKRKSTMACNFCRSRKLKCDGIRPACAQCIKRGNNCDYQSHSNAGTTTTQPQVQVVQVTPPSQPPNSSTSPRPPPATPASAHPSHSPSQSHLPHPHSTSTWRYNPTTPSNTTSISNLKHHHPAHLSASLNLNRDSDSAIDELEDDRTSEEMHKSPRDEEYRVPQQQQGQRKRVSVDMLIAENHVDQGKDVQPPPSRSPSQLQAQVPPPQQQQQQQGGWYDMSAPVNGVGAVGGMSVIDVGSEGDKKKRLNRQSANYGSKAVACVHCRARKTRCDAARPACGNCARRSLACSYNHTQPSQPRSKGKKAAQAAAAQQQQANGTTQAGSGSSSTTIKDDSSGSSTPAHVPPPLPPPPSSAIPNGTPYWTQRAPSHAQLLSPPSRERLERERERERERFIEESSERERPLPPMRERESPSIPPIATLPQPHTRSTSPYSSHSRDRADTVSTASTYVNGNGANGAPTNGRSRSGSGASLRSVLSAGGHGGEVVGMKRKTPEREEQPPLVEAKKRKWMESEGVTGKQVQPLEVRVQ